MRLTANDCHSSCYQHTACLPREKSATKEATELLSTYLGKTTVASHSHAVHCLFSTSLPAGNALYSMHSSPPLLYSWNVLAADRNLAALQKQHEAPLADSSPDAISVAEQPSNALDSSSHATPQTATHPACHFSMTKLASSGIVMLQLLTHASKQEADTDTDKQLLLGTDKSGTDTDRQLLPGTSKQGTDTDTDTYKQLLPGTSKQGTDTDTDKQLLSGTDKQFTATDKQLLPGTSQKGTDTATDKQLLPGSTQAGTDTDKELAVSTSTSDKGWTKHLQVPGTSKQGTDAVNSADIAPVDHRAEVPGHAVTGTGLILPSHQPAKVVQQILDDLQAGRLNPPQ